MDQPGFDVGDHVLTILRSLDVGGLDRDVSGRSAVCDRAGMRHDAGAVVGGLDVETIGAFGHGPIVLVSEVPGEGLYAALGRRGSRKGVDLLIRERLGADMLHPGRRAGWTVGITAGGLEAVAAAAFGSELRDIEGLDDLPVGILDPDGILVGAGAGLLVILERQLQAARIGRTGRRQDRHGDEDQSGKEWAHRRISLVCAKIRISCEDCARGWDLSGRGPMGFRRFAPASLPLRGANSRA